MSDRTSFHSSRVKLIRDLEAENARLHKEAAKLTAYLLALQNALAGDLPAPAQWRDRL